LQAAKEVLDRATPEGEDGLEASTTTNHTVRFVKSNQAVAARRAGRNDAVLRQIAPLLR